MTELSVTVTVGEGSERHNHDLDYRSTLQHVHSCEQGVIELIPYRSYSKQINEIVKPYIDAYNAKVEARYQAAWNRYNTGIIKTKPRKRDYKTLSYDYYTDHLGDTYYNRKSGKKERVPMFRSIIIGIGDKADRQSGRITEEQAIQVLSKAMKAFHKDFPFFIILGATIHLDENGFYHCHIDYKPMYESDIGQGIGIGLSQERALELMGYEPEQSVINGSDKVPLRFNSMRNLMYHRMEEAMASVGLRLQYAVSKTKDPEKNSSKNQKLEDWQATQDSVRGMQHQKNLILDALSRDFVTDYDMKEAVEITDSLVKQLTELEESPHHRWDKNKALVEFRLLDQLKSFVKSLIDFIARLYRERNFYRDKYNELLVKKSGIDVQIKSAEALSQEQQSGAAQLPKHNKQKGKEL